MGNFRTFQTAMTLTLDWVMRHTVVYHSLTSTYVLNFIQIGKTFWMYVRMCEWANWALDIENGFIMLSRSS